MAILTIQQAIAYAKSAGFSGNGLTTIVAIAMCESGLNTHPPDNMINNSRDRGILQISAMWHPEVSDAQAYDPTSAFRAGYAISSNGTNFTPWSTYPSCSNGKMSQVLMAEGNSGGATTGKAPWWTFPRVDNLGTIDPQGNFWKPDSNIQLPDGYPIVNLLPGTVTMAEMTNFGSQNVITIRLDKALNGLATHEVYQHLSGFAQGLRVGQHVNYGDLIGYNKVGAIAPMGFGFYPGPRYGSGSEWAILQNDLKPGGAQLLNPVAILDSYKNGTSNGGGMSTAASYSANSTPVNEATTKIITVSEQAHVLINQVPGFTGICEGLDKIEQFVPFQFSAQTQADVSQATQSTTQWGGWEIGVPNPFAIANAAEAAIKLPSDAIQAVAIFMITNTMAFLVRATFVAIGFIILAGLIKNVVGNSSTVSDVGKLLASNPELLAAAA